MVVLAQIITIVRIDILQDTHATWFTYNRNNPAPSAFPIERVLPLQSAAGELQTRLLQNYPDPFNPETWIPYELADDAEVSVTIYDSKGSQVRRIDVGKQPKGQYVEKAKAENRFKN